MPSAIDITKFCHVYDRGVEGWYELLEVIEPPDVLRVKGTFWRNGTRFRIGGISRKVKPEYDNGIVIRVEYAGGSGS